MSKTFSLLTICTIAAAAFATSSMPGPLEGEAFEHKRRKSEREFAFVFHVEH